MESFSELVGHTLSSVVVNDDEIIFDVVDDGQHRLFHQGDCCEKVTVDDVVGDINDLLNTPILLAYESQSSDCGPLIPTHDSYTWTFYRISTIKGTVVIRFYGTSNGYYSETVTFE